MQHKVHKFTIALGADHAGYQLKEEIKSYLVATGYEVVDYGAHSFDPGDDYPDLIAPVAKFISQRPFKRRGIIFGRSGEGEAMVANRFPHVRAAVINQPSPDIAMLARQHNDANVLSLGSGFLNRSQAVAIITTWLGSRFESGRHLRRIKKIEQVAPHPYKGVMLGSLVMTFLVLVLLGLLISSLQSWVIIADSGDRMTMFEWIRSGESQPVESIIRTGI